MWRRALRLSPVFSVSTLILSACLSIPKVPLANLDPSADAVNNRDVQVEELFRLYASMRGAQSGDVIFNRTTAVYWIVPDIDKLDLALTAREEQEFTEAEYDARLSRLLDTHKQFLIFLIDLRMPFYAGWTQGQMLRFLEQNLLVTLENGSERVSTPEHQIFQVLERFIESNPIRPSSQSLEVRVPIRVFFSRKSNSLSLVSEQTDKLVLKLRFREQPPFRIGFFDDKYYQSFKWNIGE